MKCPRLGELTTSLKSFSVSQCPHLENKAVVLDDFLGPF